MSTWTDERVALLRQYVDQVDPPLSAAGIASALGVSRNSVIGKVHRLGLKLHTTPPPRRTFNRVPRKARPKPVKSAKAPRPLTGNITRVTYFHGMTTVAPMPIPRADDVARVSFADLEPHHCRFIPGEPKDGFCGLEKVPGTSYCGGHLQRCYSTAEVTRHMAVHDKAGGEQTTAATVEEFLVPA